MILFLFSHGCNAWNESVCVRTWPCDLSDARHVVWVDTSQVWQPSLLGEKHAQLLLPGLVKCTTGLKKLSAAKCSSNTALEVRYNPASVHWWEPPCMPHLKPKQRFSIAVVRRVSKDQLGTALQTLADCLH